MVLLLFGGGGGVATSILADSERAFAVVGGPYGHTFAHELGHLMGSAHDRYAESICPGRVTCTPEQKRRSPSLHQYRPFPYSFGYVNQAAFEPDAPWGRALAYDHGL